MVNIVNLTKPESGIIISTFPDGQVGAKCNKHVYEQDVLIASRMSSYTDLFKILAVNDAVKSSGAKTVSLYCPYILSGRSDRRFESNESFDLKILASILNSAKFKKVYVMDEHSSVTSALIENCINIDSSYWIGLSIPHLSENNNMVLVSPDAGAYKKVMALSKKLTVDSNISFPTIPANKYRSHETGELQITIQGDIRGKNCFIVDDICDGGKTFIELAKVLNGQGVKNVSLFVTHGIFSNGFDNLLKEIDCIYTTNSYRDIGSGYSVQSIDIFDTDFITTITQCNNT